MKTSAIPAWNILDPREEFVSSKGVHELRGDGASIRRRGNRRRRRVGFIASALVLVGGTCMGWSLWLFFRPVPEIPPGVKVDRVVVIKSQRRLKLMSHGEVLAVFPVALGASPRGHKQFEGDEKTPEGLYVLDWRNPQSRFHLSLHVSYPNSSDREYAASLGKSPGGDIMIHGFPNGTSWWQQWALWVSGYEWTDGCIAVTNPQMDVIWEQVPNGTAIEILP